MPTARLTDAKRIKSLSSMNFEKADEIPDAPLVHRFDDGLSQPFLPLRGEEQVFDALDQSLVAGLEYAAEEPPRDRMFAVFGT